MNSKLIIGALVATTVVSTTFASVFGYQLYLKNKAESDQKAQVQKDPYSGWKTYTDTKNGFEFRYPSDWNVAQEPQEEPFSAKVYTNDAGWTFGKSIYTGGGGYLNPENFEKCFVVENNLCSTETVDISIEKTFTDGLATKRAILKENATNKIIAGEIQVNRAPIGLLAQIGISEGYYINYEGSYLNNNIETLDLISKSLKPTDSYFVTYIGQENGSENTFAFLKTKTETIKIAEATNVVLDNEHKTVIFNNYSAIKAEDMGLLYFYDIATQKITSKNVGTRLTSLVFDKTGKYLLVGDGSSVKQMATIFNYPAITKVGDSFVNIGFREINGYFYFTSLFDKPVRNSGTELDPNSTGVSKFELATGKITVVKAPTQAKDYNLANIDEMGNFKE